MDQLLQTKAPAIHKMCFEGDRLMMVRCGKPVDVVIVQVHMPTTDYKDEVDA